MKQKLLSVAYRRKREGKTDYRKRLTLLVSQKTRLVVRKSDRHMLAQLVAYDADGDKVIAQAHSNDLKDFGWKFGTKNLPACYLVGLLAGKKAVAKGVKECILDLGLQTPIHKSRVYACLKGIVDSGLSTPHSKEVFPSDDRIRGMHIAKQKPQGSQFAKLIKEGNSPDGVTAAFDAAKSMIMKVQNAKEE